MLIQHNIAAISTHRNAQHNNSVLQKDIEKLATGYRVCSAADDASGLAISEKMRARIAGLGRAEKNTEDGVSLVQFAESVLQEVQTMLDRMLELSLQGMNAVYTDDERQILNLEHQQLKDEIDRIGKSARFNGIQVFDGSDFNFDEDVFEDMLMRPSKEIGILIGDTANNYDTVKLILAKMNTQALGISSTTVANQIAAEHSASAMRETINTLSQDRGRLAAVQNRLMHANRTTSETLLNMMEAESRVKDADMARVMMDYAKHKILSETSTALISQATNLSSQALDVIENAAPQPTASSSGSASVSSESSHAAVQSYKAAQSTSESSPQSIAI